MVSHHLSGAAVALMKHMRHASWYADIPCYSRRNEIKRENRHKRKKPMKMSAQKKKRKSSQRQRTHTHARQAKTFSFLLSNDMCWIVLFLVTNKHHTALDKRFVEVHALLLGCDLKASVCVMFGSYRTTKTNRNV